MRSQNSMNMWLSVPDILTNSHPPAQFFSCAIRLSLSLCEHPCKRTSKGCLSFCPLRTLTTSCTTAAALRTRPTREHISHQMSPRTASPYPAGRPGVAHNAVHTDSFGWRMCGQGWGLVYSPGIGGSRSRASTEPQVHSAINTAQLFKFHWLRCSSLTKGTTHRQTHGFTLRNQTNYTSHFAAIITWGAVRESWRQ